MKFPLRKRKIRGLYGYWNDALYSIDIDYFESFLKQQKKDAKLAAKSNSQMNIGPATASNNSPDSPDPDEDVPDVDPSHEQLNLPQNSMTLWKILPRLDYASQVKNFSHPSNRHCFILIFQTRLVL